MIFFPFFPGVIHAHCPFSVKGSPTPDVSKTAFDKILVSDLTAVKDHLLHLDLVSRNEIDVATMTDAQKEQIEKNKEKFETYCRISAARKQVIEYATLHLGISCVHSELDPKKWKPPYGQVGC